MEYRKLGESRRRQAPGAVVIALTLLAMGAPQAARAQEPAPSSAERVAWPLVDFVVLGDSFRGVQVLLSPNLNSRQGGGGSDIQVTLDPPAARRWAYSAMHVIDSVAALNRRDRHPFALMPLQGTGRTQLVIGSDGREPPEEPFRFVIADPGAPQHTVRVTATAAQLRELLTVIDGVAQTSARDTTRHHLGVAQGVAELPRLLAHGPLHYPEQARQRHEEGRVLAEYTIDTTGRIDASSLHALLSDGDEFTAAARAALLSATFQPARLDGRPIRITMRQWINFRLDRSPFPRTLVIEY